MNYLFPMGTLVTVPLSACNRGRFLRILRNSAILDRILSDINRKSMAGQSGAGEAKGHSINLSFCAD
jgi:hypothetical protein